MGVSVQTVCFLPIIFMTFSLSYKEIKMNTRNGIPGTLYLTSAPNMGVISPIRSNIRMTKKTEKIKSAALSLLIRFAVRRHKIMIRRMMMFSIALINISGEEESVMVGRVRTLTIA